MKHLLAITIALLPSAVLAEQFTPQQMLDVMTKSPSNRDVRVEDKSNNTEYQCAGLASGQAKCWGKNNYGSTKPPSGWNEPGVFNHNKP